MAITKVGTYRNPPVDITDYEAIVAHLEAYTRQIGNQGMILTEWTNDTTQPKIAMGSYISHGGVLYVVEDEDYGLPALSSDGTYYLRVSASGDTLALDYITDLTGYVWNAIYNGLYHSDGKQVLPYQVVRVSSGASIIKRKVINLAAAPYKLFSVDYLGVTNMGNMAVEGNATIGGTLGVTGAISGAEITAQNKAVFRGRDMTYGFLSNATVINSAGQVNSLSLAIQDDGAYCYELTGPGTLYRRTGSAFSGSPIDNITISAGSYGMTWIDGKLITCSFDTIYVYNGYSNSLITSFSSPAVRCCGLGVKNGNLLSVDYGAQKIYVHSGISSTILEQISIASIMSAVYNTSANISGIVWTGENYIISFGGPTSGGRAQIVSISKDSTEVYEVENLYEIAGVNKVCGLTRRPDLNRLFITSYSSSGGKIMELLIGIK